MGILLKIEVINKFTGEIFTVEVNPYKLDSLVGALVQVQQQRKALDELEQDLKAILEEDHLAKNDYRPLTTSLGYEVKYVQGTRKTYDTTTVISHIDIDMLLSKKALAVSTGNLEKLMAELVKKNQLPSEDSRAILDSVTVVGIKPSVRLEKVK
jgi:pyocin large subunit-like protein